MKRTTTAPRRAYSRSDTDVYRERLPHAQVVALPGDGYHVAASNPDACTRAVLEFLVANDADRSHPGYVQAGKTRI